MGVYEDMLESGDVPASDQEVVQSKIAQNVLGANPTVVNGSPVIGEVTEDELSGLASNPTPADPAKGRGPGLSDLLGFPLPAPKTFPPGSGWGPTLSDVGQTAKELGGVIFGETPGEIAETAANVGASIYAAPVIGAATGIGGVGGGPFGARLAAMLATNAVGAVAAAPVRGVRELYAHWGWSPEEMGNAFSEAGEGMKDKFLGDLGWGSGVGMGAMLLGSGTGWTGKKIASVGKYFSDKIGGDLKKLVGDKQYAFLRALTDSDEDYQKYLTANPGGFTETIHTARKVLGQYGREAKNYAGEFWRGALREFDWAKAEVGEKLGLLVKEFEEARHQAGLTINVKLSDVESRIASVISRMDPGKDQAAAKRAAKSMTASLTERAERASTEYSAYAKAKQFMETEAHKLSKASLFSPVNMTPEELASNPGVLEEFITKRWNAGRLGGKKGEFGDQSLQETLDRARAEVQTYRDGRYKAGMYPGVRLSDLADLLQDAGQAASGGGKGKAGRQILKTQTELDTSLAYHNIQVQLVDLMNDIMTGAYDKGIVGKDLAAQALTSMNDAATGLVNQVGSAFKTAGKEFVDEAGKPLLAGRNAATIWNNFRNLYHHISEGYGMVLGRAAEEAGDVGIFNAVIRAGVGKNSNIRILDSLSGLLGVDPAGMARISYGLSGWNKTYKILTGKGDIAGIPVTKKMGVGLANATGGLVGGTLLGGMIPGMTAATGATIGAIVSGMAPIVRDVSAIFTPQVIGVLSNLAAQMREQGAPEDDVRVLDSMAQDIDMGLQAVPEDREQILTEWANDPEKSFFLADPVVPHPVGEGISSLDANGRVLDPADQEIVRSRIIKDPNMSNLQKARMLYKLNREAKIVPSAPPPAAPAPKKVTSQRESLSSAFLKVMGDAKKRVESSRVSNFNKRRNVPNY